MLPRAGSGRVNGGKTAGFTLCARHLIRRPAARPRPWTWVLPAGKLGTRRRRFGPLLVYRRRPDSPTINTSPGRGPGGFESEAEMATATLREVSAATPTT